MDQRAGVGGQRLRLVFVVLFAAGVLVTGYRGPYRAVFPNGPAGGLRWDFGLVYSLSRAWVIGANPYEMEGVGKAWQSSGGPAAADPSRQSRTTGVLVYPPTTFAMISPLAVLPWGVAAAIWMAANIAGVVVALGVAARLAGLRGSGLWGFLAAGVWLAPFATNIGVGQTAVVAMLLIAAGQWMRIRGGRGDRESSGPGPLPGARDSWGTGVLLGLATILKPQMGLLFVVYEAGRMRWRSAGAAAIVIALAAGIGAGRLQAAGVPWWDSWQRNLRDFSMVEDGNPTRSNPTWRHQMLNLHYPLHNFTDNRELVRWMVYAIVGGLSLAYFLVDLRRGRQKGEGRSELVSLSMTSVVSLLVVYHRFYDAVLLVFPLALAVKLIVERRERAAGWALLALCAAFFAPGAVVLSAAAQHGWVPTSLTESWVWQDVLLPHESWAILAMAVLLVRIRSRERHSPN